MNPECIIDDILYEFRQIRNEINCRIEHGADSSGHLEYIEEKMLEVERKYTGEGLGSWAR